MTITSGLISPKIDYPPNIIGLKIKIWIVNFNYSLKCY